MGRMIGTRKRLMPLRWIDDSGRRSCRIVRGMARNELIHERLTYSIIGSFYEVNNTLGFGFFESVYMAALERELLARGHRVEREVWVPVWYKGEVVARQRVDMIVDETVVVEAKAT